jgi:transglutaminase-like putative cysteine protease
MALGIPVPEARDQSSRALLWSSSAFIGGALLHVDRVPFWATAVAVACAAWQLTSAAGKLPPISKMLQLILTFVLVTCVVFTFHTLNGLPAGTVLLVVMGAIKLLETRSRRDEYIVIGAALFLLLAACLDRQTLARVPLYASETLLCCTALVMAAYGNDALRARAALRLAAQSLLLAVPLALIFFLFFPRLPGGFWALPASDEALTGLGEDMSPGSISQLITSYDPAFRVRFSGPIPPAPERYWRGPVLHEFDGYTWRRGPVHAYPAQPLRFLGTAYRYSVTLVPDANRWWFALDTVVRSPDPQVFLTYDYDLVAREPVTREVTYEALSSTHTAATASLPEAARRLETSLPINRNPRTRELAARLRARGGGDVDYVRAVVEFFRSGNFRYSLTPPKLDFDSIDDFLFHTHEGFCGHYASAFVTLMRAGGLPARVVTGYQGGEWNPIGQYFIVRQSDAHAWAEVWIEGRGWRRVDPTAIVAPERLQRGILDILPNALSGSERLLHTSPLFERLWQEWDALNTAWSERVVKFDVNMQLGILERLGVHAADWTALVIALGSGLVAWLAWIAWHVGRSARRQPLDPLARAYTRLCRKLARAGIARQSHEGPLDYAARIAHNRPDLAPRVAPLLARYARLRYGPASASGSDAQVIAFSRMVLRCSLAPAR